jgi:outer membrane protein assembly factor BamB
VSSLRSLNKETGSTLWESKYTNLQTILVLKDKIYAGSVDGEILQFYPYDGEETWRISIGHPIASLSSKDNKLVFTTRGGFSDSEVHAQYDLGAIDTETREILWRNKTDGYSTSSPVISGDRIFIATGLGKIYAINIISGRIDWITNADKELYFELYKNREHDQNPFLEDTQLTVVDNYLYVGGYGGNLYKVGEETGRLESSYAIENGCWTKSIYSDGKLFFGSSMNRMSAFDLSEKRVVWQVYLGKEKALDYLRTSPLFNQSHAIAFGPMVQLSSARVESSFKTEGEVVCPPLNVGDRIYAISKDIFYGMNPVTGEVVWRHRLAGEGACSIYERDQNIFLFAGGNEGGTLYSFDLVKMQNDSQIKDLAYFDLGKLLLRRGKLDLASTNFEAAVKKNDSMFESYRYLAEIAERKKDNDSAVSYWQKYSDFVGPIQDEEVRVQAALKRLTHYRFKIPSSPHWPGVVHLNSNISFLETPNFILKSENEKPVESLPIRNPSFFPLLANDNLFLIGRENNSIAVDCYATSDLKLKWRQTFPGGNPVRPVIFGHLLIGGIDDDIGFRYEQGDSVLSQRETNRHIFAIDINTGELIGLEHFPTQTGIKSPLLLVNDKVIIGSRPIAVSTNTIYVGSGTTNVQSDEIMVMLAENGVVAWSFKTDWNLRLAKVQKKPILRSDIVTLNEAELPSFLQGIDLVNTSELGYESGTGNNECYALDIATGNVRWRHSLGNDKVAFPQPSGKEVFFKVISKTSEAIVSLNQDTGEETWRYEVNDLPEMDFAPLWSIGLSWTKKWFFFKRLNAFIMFHDRYSQTDVAPLIVDQKLYCGFRNGRVVAIDINKKQVLWQYTIAEAIEESPMDHDEYIIVRSTAGNSYHFEK